MSEEKTCKICGEKLVYTKPWPGDEGDYECPTSAAEHKRILHEQDLKQQAATYKNLYENMVLSIAKLIAERDALIVRVTGQQQLIPELREDETLKLISTEEKALLNPSTGILKRICLAYLQQDDWTFTVDLHPELRITTTGEPKAHEIYDHYVVGLGRLVAQGREPLIKLLQECRGWVHDEDLRARINAAGVPPRLRTGD